MNFPKKVTLVEVGPRDGLQNESTVIDTQAKIEFINRLSQTGLRYIESTSFVSPEWIPQLADGAQVMQKIHRQAGIHYPVLVPNLHGLKRAELCNVTDISIFTAASETFCQKNINRSIDESFLEYAKVVKEAQAKNLYLRGYISCAFDCPYEGPIANEKVLEVAMRLFNLGCQEVAIGDTIGTATAHRVQGLVNKLAKIIPLDKLACHFHDTYGQAIANIYAALECGIATFDSSVAGLGGCPYAKGATGNVATEDVVYLLEGLGIETGVNLDKLIHVGKFISEILGRPTNSKVARARVTA